MRNAKCIGVIGGLFAFGLSTASSASVHPWQELFPPSDLCVYRFELLTVNGEVIDYDHRNCSGLFMTDGRLRPISYGFRFYDLAGGEFDNQNWFLQWCQEGAGYVGIFVPVFDQGTFSSHSNTKTYQFKGDVFAKQVPSGLGARINVDQFIQATFSPGVIEAHLTEIVKERGAPDSYDIFFTAKLDCPR